MGRTALELIGQGGFGHSLDPLIEDKRDSLAISLKMLLYVCFVRGAHPSPDADQPDRSSPIIARLGVLALFIPHARAIVPERLWGPLARILPIPAARDLKYHAEVVAQKSRELFQAKKAALEQPDEAVIPAVDERQDLMSVLCELYSSPIVPVVLRLRESVKANQSPSEKDALPEEELIAQIS